MEGHCSTGQSPQWAVMPMEEEEEQVVTRLQDDQLRNQRLHYLLKERFSSSVQPPDLLWR